MGDSKAPPGWGDDPLSKFIQGTTDNTYATFHNLKEWYNRLRDIHQAFSKVAENMDRTADFFPRVGPSEVLVFRTKGL